MKTPNLKKSVYIIVTLILIAFVVIKLKKNKGITQSKVYQYDKNEVLNVEVDTVKLEITDANLSYSGTFEPNKEAKISADIQGKINEVLVDVGSVVKQGQPLLQLDNSILKIQLQTIEVQIEGLVADVNRYSILVKADAVQGVQLEKSELGLKTAKLQRATLLDQIEKSTVTAPFSGVITAKLTEIGQFAAPGVPLLQLTDISKMKFTVNVAENELRQFELNKNYTLTSDAYPEISLNGTAYMVGSKANMGSSFPIQFMVNNTSELKIKSGMFGKILIKNDSKEKVIVISASSVVGSEEQPQVYIVKEGKAVLQSITISKKIQNKAVVSTGLKAGDIIVINGFINLFEGANVSFK